MMTKEEVTQVIAYCHSRRRISRCHDLLLHSHCNKADVNPREWMVHHTTEVEHVAAILKSRAKRKESEEEASKEESK